MVDTILSLHAMVEDKIGSKENLGLKDLEMLEPFVEMAVGLQAMYEFKQKMQKPMPSEHKPTMASTSM